MPSPLQVEPHTLAPDIVRNRLLIEGYYAGAMDEARLAAYMQAACAHLNLRAYAEPIIYAPGRNMGSPHNEGFDAFMPLIDSGISAYVWTQKRFFSVLIYSCAEFDRDSAVEFTLEALKSHSEYSVSAF